MKRSGPIRRKKPLRNKKPLKPGKGLSSGAGPKRKKRIRARNPERVAEKFERNFNSKAYVVWTKQQPCLFCGSTPCVTGHVLHARGMGGAHGDWQDTGPVCFECDQLWENKGREALLEARGMTWRDTEHAVALHHDRWITEEAL